MRGNFSLTQFPTSEKGALWMQQGRPLLDSDWNAQISLAEDAVRKKIQSLIGDAGAPAESAGFAITPIAGLLVNEDAEKQTFAEGMFLLADSSLPFPIGDTPARPFHLQLGFRVYKKEAGAICHVPGLFLLSLSKANRLTISANIVGEDGQNKKTSSTGKKVIAPDELVRVDIVYDGEAIEVFLCTSSPDQPEVRLDLGCSAKIGFDPLALVLGCAQKSAIDGGLSEKSGQGPWFNHALHASFWHLAIVDDFLEFARQMPLGDTLGSDQDGLVCSLDFRAIIDDQLADCSPFSNNGVLLIGDKEPSITLLDIMISKGNYIAHGRYYQNTAACQITEQPNLPQQHLPPPGGPEISRSYQRYYMDCWQRFVTDLEAPENHDLALGDIDTTASLQNIWQIKSIAASSPEALSARWETLATPPNAGQIKLRRPNDYLAIKNGLLRVEVHHSGWTANWPIDEAALLDTHSATLVDGKRQFLHIEKRPRADRLLQLDRPVLLFVIDGDRPDSSAELEQATHTFTTIIGVRKGRKYDKLTLADAAPKVGKNQTLFILPVASYKFSTKNGCLSYPISNLSWLDGGDGLSANLSFPGYNGLEIKNGDWLELGNLALEQTERPGPMFQVEDFMSDRLQLLLSALPGYASARTEKVPTGEFPTLTIWGENLAPLASPPIGPGWNKLTDGIEVEFSPGGYYKSGQYWTAAMRSAAPKGIIWPGVEHGKPVFCNAEGPQHQYVALADIIHEPTSLKCMDKRHLFRSLIDEPFADLDDKTASVLRETAAFMEMIGLPDWHLTPADLPDFLRDAIRRMLHELYNEDLRLLGVNPEAPQGLRTTGQKLTLPDQAGQKWGLNEEIPEEMQGDGFAAFLAGQPVYINQKDNGIWTCRDAVSGWQLLTHVPDDRHAYSVAWDNERLYIVGGRRHGLITDGAAKHIIALNSVGEWHTVGTMRHYTGYPSAVCIGDNLLVTGGIDFEGNDVRNVGYVDLKRRRWHSLDDDILGTGAYSASITYGGQWYIFGGEGKHSGDKQFHISDRVRLYDPVTRTWQDRKPMPVPLAGHQVRQSGDKITVYGGKIRSGEFSPACYHYYPNEDRWSEAGFMSEPRAFFGLLPRMEAKGRSLVAVGGMVEEGFFSAFADVGLLDKTYYFYE